LKILLVEGGVKNVNNMRRKSIEVRDPVVVISKRLKVGKRFAAVDKGGFDFKNYSMQFRTLEGQSTDNCIGKML